MTYTPRGADFWKRLQRLVTFQCLRAENAARRAQEARQPPPESDPVLADALRKIDAGAEILTTKERLTDAQVAAIRERWEAQRPPDVIVESKKCLKALLATDGKYDCTRPALHYGPCAAVPVPRPVRVKPCDCGEC